jgi:putative nucleotidyltransferase with HDIG domain
MRDDLSPPNRETCLKLLKQYRVPPHVIQHCIQVERVARFLGQALNEHGARLDLHLVEAAALLHDITKLDGLQTGRNHAETGGELLRKLGYVRIAEVVERHVAIPEELMSESITEDELVNYADKRVMHDLVVTLEERVEDLKRRYGKTPKSQTLIKKALENMRAMERKIFHNLPIRPEVLPECLENETKMPE